MGTAGGEPRVLLNALKPMLGVVGDIKTPQEVMRVVGMMKDAEKLMSRCVYLNILKATCRQAKQSEAKRETLEKFLVTGGWGILNKWLHEFTKSENFPVLLELIDVLKILPITVELLKQGNTGKLIKQMTKLEHADVKKNAGSLIKQWKDMIRGGPEKKGEENGDELAHANKRNRDVDGKGPPEKKIKMKSNDPNSKQIADSTGFMNALIAAVPVSVKKKRRNSKDSKDLKTTLPLDEILNRSSGDKRLKLESDNEKNISPDSPTTEQENSEDPSVLLGFSPAVEAANQALAEDTDTTVVVDEGSLARKKNKKKRNITWAPDESLVKTRFFELLEGERKGHHSENFSQARQHELLLEKQALRAARRSEDKMNERMRWSRLIPVDNAGVPNFIPGEKSREKYFQAEREKSVLAFIFLSKDSLPDNPAEPDFDADDHSNNSQPRVIPHDEDGTVLPPPKPVSTNNNNSLPHQSNTQRQTSLADEDYNSNSAPNVTKNERPNNQQQQKQGNRPDVSPAVQNIMSQLLRNNNNQFPPTHDHNSPLAHDHKIPLAHDHIIPNIGPSILGQPGNNGPSNNMLGNTGSNNNFNTNPDNIPSILSRPIPNPRGRGNGGRFNGNRGGPINRGRGGFNQRGGQRPRWDGPQQQGPNEDWNNYNDNYNDNNYNDNNYNDNYNDNNYNDNNYNDNYNDNGYNDNNFDDGFGGGFNGPPKGRNDGFNDNFNNSGRGGGGFRRGGKNRGRGGGNYDRRGGDWNQDDGSYDRRDNFNPNRGRGGGGSRNRDDKGLCQHFLSPRGCRHGDRCKFIHAR